MFNPAIATAITINDSGFTLLDLANRSPASVAIQCRTNTEVYLANTEIPDPARVWTLKAGGVLVLDLMGGSLRGTSKIYAKSKSGTAQIEILYLN